MRKYLIFILISFLLAGCAALKTNKTGVCDDPAVASNSYLCQVAKDQSMQVEDFKDIILDAELVSFISSGVNPDSIMAWCDEALKYLEAAETNSDLTYIDIFYLLETDAKAKILFRILSRRLDSFKIPQVVTSTDMKFLAVAVKEIRSEAEFYKVMK